MKSATVRDLRYDFPRIEAWLAGGEDVLITKHAKPVARLDPPRQGRPAPQTPPPGLPGTPPAVVGRPCLHPGRSR
ncbi:MAG: type II toxin-antitoxin system Phd/YefM family antitoxin [Bdellovibrionaceae bacterium]|nr:type II toxin-antitoxin system Phd/YefM family antitoxin [Pseudobdellovibrionaceae bacterium]